MQTLHRITYPSEFSIQNMLEPCVKTHVVLLCVWANEVLVFHGIKRSKLSLTEVVSPNEITKYYLTQYQ